MALGRRKNSGRTDWSTSGSGPAPAQSGSDTLVEERPAKAAKPAKAGKAPKEPKAPKAAKAPKPPKARGGAKASGGIMAEVLYEGPSRAEMEQEAAAELQAALAVSYNKLRAEVPDAGSPDDAQRRLESELARERAVPDIDAGIPSHPIYSGDTLVYQQLRRHYGREHAGGSFRRSWYPLQPS